MKPSQKILLLLFGLLLIITILVVKTPKKPINNEPETLQTITAIENNGLEELWGKMILCESSGKRLAFVEKDGGSASYGLLMWKPETFREKLLKYGMIGEKADWNYIMTIIWDEKINKMLFFKIMEDRTENPYKLWYVCCKKHNCAKYR